MGTTSRTRRLTSAYSMLRAHADAVLHGPVQVRPGAGRHVAEVEHNCQRCGLWITVGDPIVLGLQAEYTWWVHTACPDPYEAVDWLSVLGRERELDFVTSAVSNGRPQRCARCDEVNVSFYLVRRPGPLPVRPAKHSDYVCGGCVRL